MNTNKCSYGCGQEAKYQLKNGKWCCESSSNKCSTIKLKNSNSQKVNFSTRPFLEQNHEFFKCNFCGVKKSDSGIQNHERGCYLNPKNIKLCLYCKKPIKHWKTATTCGYSCSNKYYNRSTVISIEDACKRNVGSGIYKRICFDNHEKKCICCDEKNIVAVHHYDENKKNNKPENLLPLCPTHHCYWHSKFKRLIIDKVEEYRKHFNKL